MRLIILLLSLTLTGCATFNAISQSPLMEASVRVAVGVVLNDHPAWVVPAYRYTSMAMSALRDNGLTDLAALDDIFIDVIAEELTPEEQDLAMVLFVTIRQAIVDDLARRGFIDAEKQKLYALQALTWINQTAKMRL